MFVGTDYSTQEGALWLDAIYSDEKPFGEINLSGSSRLWQEDSIAIAIVMMKSMKGD